MIKRSLRVFVWSILFLSSATLAQDTSAARAEDEKAIRAVIASLAEAWTAGDAQAWGKLFTEDADFTVWNGMYIKGREAIEQGHKHIFNTFFKDTKMRYLVRSIRFLREGVALAHVDASVVKKNGDFPASPHAVPLLVVVKDKGQWRIAAYQNTNVQTAGVTTPVAAKLGAGTLAVKGGQLYYETEG